MKQRLIDANNLYADYIVTSTTTNTLCYRYISKEQVENAPTVEAIPIEWLEKWKKGKTSIEQVVADKIMMDYIHRD